MADRLTPSQLAGEGIRLYRTGVTRMSQARLATALGIDQAQVSRLERGLRPSLTVEELFAAAAHLSVSPSWLLDLPVRIGYDLRDRPVTLLNGASIPADATFLRWLYGDPSGPAGPLDARRAPELEGVRRRGVEVAGQADSSLTTERRTP